MHKHKSNASVTFWGRKPIGRYRVDNPRQALIKHFFLSKRYKAGDYNIKPTEIGMSFNDVVLSKEEIETLLDKLLDDMFLVKDNDGRYMISAKGKALFLAYNGHKYVRRPYEKMNKLVSLIN